MGLNIITEMVLKFFTEKNIKKKEIEKILLPKRTVKIKKRVAERHITETEKYAFHKLAAEKTFWPK